MCHFVLVNFYLGFGLNYDRNLKSVFCFINSFIQIAKIHLQRAGTHTLNHNKSLIFLSSFSYYVRERRK